MLLQNPPADNPNPENIKMRIDFTNLADMAQRKGYSEVAKEIIKYEQSIVKKIPFLL
jgi:hypothetical protein